MFWILNLLPFLTSSLPSPSSDLKVPDRELRWRRQRKRPFEKAFAFFQTLSRLFQSAENVKCRQISLELISWGPHLSWERARKKNSSSLVNREIRHFHVIVVQWRNGNVPKSVMHVHACASAIKEQKKCWEFLAQKFDRFQTLRSKPQTTRKRTQHVPSNNVASFCTGRKTFVLRPRP